MPGLPNVFAIGDTALVGRLGRQAGPRPRPRGQAGRDLCRAADPVVQLEGRPAPAAFRYRHLGSLATIGRRAAVVDFRLAAAQRPDRPVALGRGPAIAFLAGMRNRLAVALDWFLGLSDLPAQHPTDHRRGAELIRRSDASPDIGPIDHWHSHWRRTSGTLNPYRPPGRREDFADMKRRPR